ncbi:MULTISPECIES: hypothetical protein [Nocardiopsis]|uniref:Uncharacterized protein n=1 Tax=Nocardiopsis sinuspersici TaxID=501010 RepID=A0A1V3C0G3_9ACTN|nr:MULTISPECIES: hypothetical protein [Nocardiopsis]OOC54294.1 hypothetical protein NOSIN_11165 [Nocardiopsis sinuspersici]
MTPEEPWDADAYADAADGTPPETRGNDRSGPSAGNTVQDNQGQVVSADSINGGVHQYHQYREFLGEAATRRLRHAAELGPDRVREILATFCPSDARKYTAFTEELARHRLGLVTGEPGRGRTSAAIHALATLRPGEPVDEVIADADVADAGLAGITLSSERPRFMDLSDLRGPGAEQRAAVRKLVEKVRASGALLIVICRSGPWEQELAACRARLRVDAPAHAVDVFRHVMGGLYGVDRARRWAADPRVAAALSGAGPDSAVRLARDAERTSSPHAPLAEEDHTAWIERALKEFTDAADVLPGWFPHDRDDRENEFLRVLTQAVALLEGAPSPTVVHHAHGLAERWGVSPMRPTPISGGGFTEYLSGIGAHLHQDRVRFHRPGHGDDALGHLWREHPDARASFQEWACAATPALSRGERVEVARRWLTLARRYRDPAPLETLLDQWSASPTLQPAAVPAIAEAAVTRELGAPIRNRLYRIASSRKPTPRDRMVLEVCRVYGRIQPKTALTRLRHLAGKAQEAWKEDLLRALEDIAAEPGNLPVVLDAVSEWVDGDGRRSTLAARALLRLLEAQAPEDFRVLNGLRRGALEPGTVSAAWCAVHLSAVRPDPVLWSWLDALAVQRRTDGPVPASLLGAASRNPGFADTLGRCARRWSHAHTRTSPAVEELRCALDET